MDQNKIGKFISELRKEKDLTQEQLANKIGITKNAVSKWERGISMMEVSQSTGAGDYTFICANEIKGKAYTDVYCIAGQEINPVPTVGDCCDIQDTCKISVSGVNTITFCYMQYE